MYARRQLKGFEVYEHFEALTLEFHLSKRYCELLSIGQVSDCGKLQKYCSDLRKSLDTNYRAKSASSYTSVASRILAHDAIQVYKQCNSRNRDIDKDITAEELLFVCRRLKKMKQNDTKHDFASLINADRIYRTLTDYRGGILSINTCGCCKNTFAASIEQNTQSNCTVCNTGREVRKIASAQNKKTEGEVVELAKRVG